MAEKYGFFDGETLYGQDELLRYYDNMFESGIAVNDDGEMAYKVTAGSGNVQVAKGYAILRGAYNYNDSPKTIAIKPDTNYKRIDRVVLRLDYSAKTCTIELKQGTASSAPTPPTLQQDNIRHELSLAQVAVGTAGDLTVTDERYRQELCGAIRPKYLTEIDTMLQDFETTFDNWFNKQTTKGWTPIVVQENAPSNPTRGMIWI